MLDSLVANKWLYLDPGKIYEVNDQAAQNLLYDPLYQIPDGSNLTAIEPLGAADVPTMSADGLTATIKLRDGMKFHNSGNIATSADWVFSIQRLANLKGNPSFLFTDFFESITAIDPLTIELKLKAPNAALLAILVSAPFAAIDSVVAKEHGGTDASDADQTDTLTDWINEGNSLGTGPYKLTGWDPNTEVTLEANTDYWGDAPAVRPRHLPQRRRSQHPAPVARNGRSGPRTIRSIPTISPRSRTIPTCRSSRVLLSLTNIWR